MTRCQLKPIFLGTLSRRDESETNPFACRDRKSQGSQTFSPDWCSAVPFAWNRDEGRVDLVKALLFFTSLGRRDP